MRDERLWTWHIAAGLLMLVVLGLHMAVVHLNGIVGIFNPAGGRPIDYANVVARGKSAFFLVLYGLLLGAGLFHGLYGFRSLLFELNPTTGTRKTIGRIVVVVGVVLFSVGAWAAWTGFEIARAS